MNEFNENTLIQQGWQCPICKRVYSPNTSMCMYCGNGNWTINTGTKFNYHMPFDTVDIISNMLDNN